MKRTKLKELACPTIPNLQRKEIFTENWAGFKTLQSSAPRTTRRCIQLTVNFSTALETTTTCSMQLLWQTMNSSERMLPSIRWPESVDPERTKGVITALAALTDLGLLNSEQLLWWIVLAWEAPITTRHSSCRKSKVTSSKWLSKSSAQWATLQRFHFFDRRWTLQSSVKRILVVLERDLCLSTSLPISSDQSDASLAKSLAGTTTSNPFQSTTSKCTPLWESLLNKSESSIHLKWHEQLKSWLLE